MALNKYMHPRNIYKIPPDYAKLAKSFEEFSSISKVDVTGKVTIDFKDPHSLRVLTKCLLKSDFGLDVVIPEDRLVPTLPLRLNYILWIEDLLNSIERTDNIVGLDIGTGACAIYPLLAVVKNKWHMLGTETDQESLLKAQENVNKNNLQNFIQLSKNTTATLVDYIFKQDNVLKFDFCMCNPPFYSNLQELCESRSPARLPPKNGFTGSPQELITEGGELAFCRKMIKESQIYQDRILIFTTMVGHKYNLKELEQELKAEGITYTSTEFCQGRVTRWGLAWTFRDLDISKLVPAREKPRRKISPIVYLLPQLPELTNNFTIISTKLLDILQSLKISYKVLNKIGTSLALDINATENTWSNQRRKRRLLKQLAESEAKKPKVLDADAFDNKRPCEKLTSNNNSENAFSFQDDNKSKKQKENGTVSPTCSIGSNVILNVEYEGHKIENKSADESIINLGTSKAGGVMVSKANTSSEELIVHAFLKLHKKENEILLEMEFLSGKAGKEGLHQIMQYIKNNWK